MTLNKIFDFINKHTHSASKKAIDEKQPKAHIETVKSHACHRQRIEKKKIELPPFITGSDARDYVQMHRGLGIETLKACSNQIKDRTIKNAYLQAIFRLEDETSARSVAHGKKVIKEQRAKISGKAEDVDDSPAESEEYKPFVGDREVQGSMSSQEFSFKLLECQKHKGTMERRLNLDLSPHELYLIKSGGNIPIKTLETYLEILNVHITYMNRRADYGYVTFSKDKATFVSKEYSTKLSDIHIEGSWDLLKYINENGYRLSFATNKTLEPVSTAVYPKKEELGIVRTINNVLLKAIASEEISFHALAKSMQLSAKGLERFLYNVVDYDYKMIDVILKRIGLIGMISLRDLGHGRLDEQDGNLYIILDSQGGTIRNRHHLLCQDFTNKKISDLARILINNGFTKFYTAKRNNESAIDFSLLEEKVDKHGKRNFYEYDKHELEALVKWKRCGYHPNGYCDYCRYRGLKVSLYTTKDRRIIQLCDQCKDKIHPINHYVKIIYTPNGGQNKRY